jgi:DNA polymerase-3 subunit delta'
MSMMIPLIITERGKVPRPPHPDFLEIEGGRSIGVEKVKEIRRFLALKAYTAKTKVVLIRAAEKLTVPAQNALLKILEEPPEGCQIILETDNLNALLPTVLSRCQIKKPKDQKPKIKKMEIVIPDRVGERLKMVGQYGKNRETAEEFLKSFIGNEREKLLRREAAAVKNLRLSLEALKYLAANCNPGLVIGNLLVKYQGR